MTLSPTTKKWILSSAITFVAAFCIAVLPSIDTITTESLRNGAIIGLILTGVRAAVKALMEGFVAWYSTRKQ